MFGCEVVQVGKFSLFVVPDFDELEDFDSGLVVLSIRDVIDQFRLEDFEEVFGYGVVPAVSFSAHALEDPVGLEQVPEFPAGILYSPVRMEDEFFGIDWPVADSHFESGDDGVAGFHVPAHGPADDFPVKQIQHDGQVEPALVGPHIGDVRHLAWKR